MRLNQLRHRSNNFQNSFFSPQQSKSPHLFDCAIFSRVHERLFPGHMLWIFSYKNKNSVSPWLPYCNSSNCHTLSKFLSVFCALLSAPTPAHNPLLPHFLSQHRIQPNHSEPCFLWRHVHKNGKICHLALTISCSKAGR